MGAFPPDAWVHVPLFVGDGAEELGGRVEGRGEGLVGEGRDGFPCEEVGALFESVGEVVGSDELEGEPVRGRADVEAGFCALEFDRAGIRGREEGAGEAEEIGFGEIFGDTVDGGADREKGEEGEAGWDFGEVAEAWVDVVGAGGVGEWSGVVGGEVAAEVGDVAEEVGGGIAGENDALEFKEAVRDVERAAEGFSPWASAGSRGVASKSGKVDGP